MKPIIQFNRVLSTFSMLAAAGAVTAQVGERPNVILILADDLGYAGTTAFGGINLETPALDWLASEGVICTNFHANAPVCSPTRISILTGSYQQRVGKNGIYSATDSTDGLDPVAHPAFAKQMKEAGYHTGIFGKWHLGLGPSFNPTYHGFDEFVGFLIGNIDLASHRTRFNTIDWWHNTVLDEEEEGYGTDLFNEYAVQFIKDCEGEPFFLYIPHAAIHTPIVAPGDPPYRDGVGQAGYDNARDLTDEEYQRRYRAMVKSIDDGLQMIIDELTSEGILDNTLIIFTSDNGAEQIAAEKYPGANGYFNGWKNTLYEGGTREPAIFYYPKAMQHRTNCDLMLTMDLMPTILEFCGIENERKIDGVSLLPALIDNEPMPERIVFWANGGSIAMQSGDWKLVRQRNSAELFNMLIDPKEQHDLSATYPERTENMVEATDNWWNEVTSGTALEGTPAVNTNAGPGPGAIPGAGPETTRGEE